MRVLVRIRQLSSGASAAHLQDRTRRAEMRIEYKAQGCRLPFGFFNELQVRLSASDSVNAEAGLHFAPDAAVVDRIAGSLLSESYEIGVGIVREWVIVSRPWADGTAGKEQKNIRVMGWVELSSSGGATDWRLFKRVMREIEKMRMRTPGLELQIAVWCVNAHGKPATWQSPTSRHLVTQQIISFRLADKPECVQVQRNFVIPDLEFGSVSQLIKADTEHASAQAQSVQQGTLAADKAHRIDAFFANKVGDDLIDVNSEGQKMMRIIMNPGSGWECIVNPQPTLDDLYKSISLARKHNLRVLHLAGHGKNTCEFIWNRDDAATASRKLDPNAIAQAIGAVSQPYCPIECAVLNACSTHAMGENLRQCGVPCVLCWKTPVQDETAWELCKLFYRALVEDASGARDYKRAFFAATDALRLGSCTGGAAHLPRGEQAIDDLLWHQDADTMVEVDEMAALPVGMGEASRRGPVLPWHQEDVVQFLSKNGNSDPIYLWREQQEVSAPCAAQQPPAAKSLDAALSSLFEQHGLGALCAYVCKELGVDNCGDLAEVEPKDVKNLNLRPVHEKKLLKMIGPLGAGGAGGEEIGFGDGGTDHKGGGGSPYKPKFGDGPRVALCIGNDNYPGNSRLPNCVADAEDMHNCFKRLGFDQTFILKNANKRDIMQQVREMRGKHIKDGSLVGFFFSGHGVEHEGVSYLLPLGMASTNEDELPYEDDLPYEAVSLDVIMRTLSNFTSTVIFILLDCCRANELNGTFKKSKGSDGHGANIVGKNLRSKSRNAEFLVGSACDPGTFALPNGHHRNSRYTEALLRHLPVAGRKLEESMKEVTKDVYKDTDKKQRPWYDNCLMQDVVLVPAA